MTFQNNKSWAVNLQKAVRIYNSTQSPSLDGMSPTEVLGNKDNWIKLQAFYMKRRSDKAKPFLKLKPYFKLNESVRKVLVEGFRSRGFKPRYDLKSTYKITAILADAVPIAYRISEHGNKLFYKQ